MPAFSRTKSNCGRLLFALLLSLLVMQARAEDSQQPTPAEQSSGPERSDVKSSLDEEKDPTCICHEAKSQFDAGNYEPARKLYEEYVTKLEATQGPKGYDVARMLQMVGASYRHLYKYKEAEKAYRKSIAILQSTRRMDDPELASAYVGMANVYSDQHIYGDAIKYTQDAIDLLSGFSHPSAGPLSHALFTLAYALQESGQLAKAEATYLQAIEKRREDPALMDKEMASMLGNLSHIYIKREQYEKAEPLLVEKLALAAKLVKKNPKTLDETTVELATCYDRRGKQSEGDELFSRVLKEQSEIEGNEVAVALLAQSAGSRLIDQMRFTEAIPYCQQAVNLRKEKAISTPGIVVSLNNLSLCYFRTNRFSEAEPVCKQVVEILSTSPEKDSTKLEQAYRNYEKVLRKLGKTEEAENLKQKQMKAQSSSH